MTIKKNGTYPQVSSPPEKHWKGKEMQFDSFGRVLALLRRGSTLPWRRGLKLKVSRDPPVTVEEREEVGGGGEKPDPAEEGKEDEEDGGGGGGEEEGERDQGGCCQLEEWLDAVGDSPLTLGHPLLEGSGVINQPPSASHIHPPNLHHDHLEERRVGEGEDWGLPRQQRSCWQPYLGAVMIEDDTGDDHDYDHENGYQHRNPHLKIQNFRCHL